MATPEPTVPATTASATDAPAEPTFFQYALGYFILGHLALMFTANIIVLGLINNVEHRIDLGDDSGKVDDQFKPKTLVEDVRDRIGFLPCRAMEVTGQWQMWGMFAPKVSTRAGFLGLVMRWPAGARETRPVDELFRSDFEPDNPRHYVRLPSNAIRLYNYEWRQSKIYWILDPDKAKEKPEDSMFLIRWFLSRNRPFLDRYLKCRLGDFARSHPGLPAPTSVTLVERLYQWTPPLQEPAEFSGPRQVDLCEWRLGTASTFQHPVIEEFRIYNPVVDRFESLDERTPVSAAANGDAGQ